MTSKWTTKYGLAAVLTAVLVISIAFFANPSFLPKQVSGQTSFAVLLTDPPIVPEGTTVLNLTYSDISIHLTYTNGTSQWLSVGSSGYVNSFELINMSKTIASTTIPTNTTVDKIQLTVSNVSAVIKGTTYNVTTLSNTLVMSVANSMVNQTLSGVLVDFNPTLIEIQSVDATGNPVNYFVLAPSATASVVGSIDQAQIRVGTIVKIGENGQAREKRVVQNFSQDLSVTAASLSVKGNVTSLSVTLTNNGDVTFRIYSLMLHGDFNSTLNWAHQFPMPNRNPDTIPFQINNTDLVPILGPSFGMMPMIPQDVRPMPMTQAANLVQPLDMRMGQGPQNLSHDMGGMGGGDRQPFSPKGDYDDQTAPASPSYLVLQPGQTVTLTYSGVISFVHGQNFNDRPALTMTPLIGNTYTIQLTGEGFQTYTVTATA
ncbi:MAG: hypothetical protein ABSE15_03585 [Candidatus Bathyarchaeia archaeon]|jgi:hypothetical protein